MNFQELNISEEIKKAVVDLKYEEATQIQEKSIPIILDGKDVIGFSQTGSGKTAAFGIPAIEMVDMDMDRKSNQVLILCPTRELALQASDELRKFSKYYEGLNIVSIFGGQNIERQFKQLRQGSQIVVGTPGRIMDHLRRKTLKLDNLKMIVLDEADEMLNMGFREDIETILETTPETRQTVLFSATMPKEILDITNKYQKNPELVKIKNKQMTVDTIEQKYYLVDKKQKKSATALLMRYYNPNLAIIFCNTKKMVDELVEYLTKNKFSAQGLHGDVKQQQRTTIMNQFKKGMFHILVATDVAARGIDVNNLDVVINYDLPDDNEYYIHRIGRTGRAGNEGKSFTLIDGRRQLEDLQRIERYAKCEIKESKLPSINEIKEQDYKHNIERIKKYMDTHNCDNQMEKINSLMEEGYSLETIACALMNLAFKKNSDYSGLNDVDALVVERRERTPFSTRRGNDRNRNNRGRVGYDRNRGDRNGDGYQRRRNDRRDDRNNDGYSKRRNDKDGERYDKKSSESRGNYDRKSNDQNRGDFDRKSGNRSRGGYKTRLERKYKDDYKSNYKDNGENKNDKPVKKKRFHRSDI